MFAYAAGSNFDSNAKQWRLFADCMNDIGGSSSSSSSAPGPPGGSATLSCHTHSICWLKTHSRTQHTGLALFFLLHTCFLCTPVPQPTPRQQHHIHHFPSLSSAAATAMALDLASPLVPGGFMLLASLGSVSRAMVGMSAGATGAALTQHFACGRNAADISAKADSRERATSIIGSLLGMAVTQHLAGGCRGCGRVAEDNPSCCCIPPSCSLCVCSHMGMMQPATGANASFAALWLSFFFMFHEEQ